MRVYKNIGLIMIFNIKNLIVIICLALTACSSTSKTDVSSLDLNSLSDIKLCEFFVEDQTRYVEMLLVDELEKRDIKICDASGYLKPVPLSESKRKAKKAQAAKQEAKEKELVAIELAKKDAEKLKRAVTEDAIADGYLSVTGLVAGMSSSEQVERRKRSRGFVIGGFQLSCTTEFLDDRLASLVCATGEEYHSKDIIVDTKTATNVKVHTTLVKGFTRKYGPGKSHDSTMRNLLGVEFDVNRTVWFDKRGNRLTLISRAGGVNIGGLTFESSEYIKIQIDNAEKEYKARNF